MNRLLDKHLTIIYDSQTYKGKQTLAYAKSLDDVVIEQDINVVHFSSSYLMTLLEKLHLEPNDLINKSHPYYQEKLKNYIFDNNDWVHILQHNMSLLKCPIAIKNNQVILCNTPTEVYKMAS